MIPEFIAWDREDKKMGQQIIKHVCAEDGTEFKMIAFIFRPDSMFSKTKIITLAESLDSTRYAPYPYIHRKDKDGNKVYEGSIVSDGTRNREVVYNEVDMGWYLKRDGLLWKLCAEDFNWNKVIGHIAEEG